MKYLHRFIFWSLMVVGVVWGIYALRFNPFSVSGDLYSYFELLKVTYVLGASAVFWPLSYVLLIDYIHSRRGRHGQHFFDYAKPLQKDFVVAGLTALLLAGIYWLDSADYGFSGVDIAFVGVPFLINALYTLVQCTRMKVVGRPVRKRRMFVMAGVVLSYIGVTTWLLVRNSSNELDVDQALFLQITIVFSGLSFFLLSHYTLHCLSRGRFLASPFQLYFFNVIVKSKHQVYEKSVEQLEAFNRHITTLKSQNAAKIRKTRKSKHKAC
ncbi:hypothetical protein ACJ6YJ_13695 [Pseudomonas marginalis]|uniref:hypothetical protein n=1 Tax=Pseudomonas TaxID=286 RepID=UPI00389AED63